MKEKDHSKPQRMRKRYHQPLEGPGHNDHGKIGEKIKNKWPGDCPEEQSLAEESFEDGQDGGRNIVARLRLFQDHLKCLDGRVVKLLFWG